jgi:hypothetical protein
MFKNYYHHHHRRRRHRRRYRPLGFLHGLGLWPVPASKKTAGSI